MNIFRNQQEISARLGPITGIIKDKRFIPRIKPLYFCTEKEVTIYSHLMGFDVIYTECPYSTESYRGAIQEMLNNYERDYSGTKRNVIKSFLKTLPELKKKYHTDEKPNACKGCGEPSRQEYCKVCQLLQKIRPKKRKIIIRGK